MTLALVVYVDHQGSLENQEIMAGMDPKDYGVSKHLKSLKKLANINKS